MELKLALDFSTVVLFDILIKKGVLRIDLHEARKVTLTVLDHNLQ